MPKTIFAQLCRNPEQSYRFPLPPPLRTRRSRSFHIQHICTYLRLCHILAANLSNFKVNSHANADISSTNAQSHWPDPQSGDRSLTGNAPSEGGTKSTAEWGDKTYQFMVYTFSSNTPKLYFIRLKHRTEYKPKLESVTY